MVRVVLIVIVVVSLVGPQTLTAGQYVLSFDDAPRGDTFLSGAERAKRLLDALERHEIDEAVFYANSRSLKAGKVSPRLKLYADAGHIIANHTATHPNLETIAADEFVAEIQRADRVLSLLPTYKRWFRYPYLREAVDDTKKHAAVKDYLNGRYKQGYVTVEVYDWHLDWRFQQRVASYTKTEVDRFGRYYVEVLWESLQFYDRLAVQALGRSPIHVILLHENDINALFLEDFLVLAKRQGFTPVAASKAFDDPIADTKWDAMPNSMRRIRTIAEARGFSREETTPNLLRTMVLDQELQKRSLLAKQGDVATGSSHLKSID